MPQDSFDAPSKDELSSDVELLEADRGAPPVSVVRKGATFDSFKHADFTWFWLGSLVSNTGTWMQTAALAIVVWGLRSRELDLGMVNFVSGIPVLFLALPAGVIADRYDKRKLLIWSQLLLGVLAAWLWLLSRRGALSADHAVVALIWIAGIGLGGGILSAITFPAWQSFLPDLVPRPSLMNAIALNSAQFQSSRLLGPLAASGLLLLGFASGDIFLVNAMSYLVVIGTLLAIRPKHTHEPTAEQHAARKRESTWTTLTAGIRYCREHPAVGMLIISTALMTVFAMPYMMLLPAIAEKALGGGKIEYSWLMAANGFGAMIGSLAVAGLPSDTDRERIIPAAIMVMAVLLIAFSASRWLPLSLLLSAMAGVAFLTINSLTNTSVQSSVPGQLRGRVMSLFVMSFVGIMPVSSAIFGVIGEWVGPTQAVAAGAVVLFGWGAYLAVSGRLKVAD